MKTLAFWVTLLFISPIFAESISEKHLSLGQSLAIPVKGPLWIENSKVIRLKKLGHQVLLTAVGSGSSLVRNGSLRTRYSVFPNESLDRYQRIKAAIEQQTLLSVHLSKGVLAIEGRIFHIDEWRRALKSCSETPCRFKATASPQIKDQIQKEVSRILLNQNLPIQSVLFSELWQVRLSPKSTNYQAYSETLSELGIQVVPDENAIELKTLVRIQITVAEVRRDYIRKLGLRWPSTYSANLLPDNTWEPSPLPFSIEALESSGNGRILASPQLLTRSGNDAQFLAGGEVPIKIINYKHQSVDWKSYGISLKILPVADSSGRMSIKIETEISNIDESRKVDDLPAFTRNRVSSHFDLINPRTIVLSGLIRNEEAKNSEGFPFLGRIPILGSLFSSKDFKESRTELIVLVRPEIIDDEKLLPLHSVPQNHLTE